MSSEGNAGDGNSSWDEADLEEMDRLGKTIGKFYEIKCVKYLYIVKQLTPT